MKWRDCLPADAGSEELFRQFKEKAEELTVKVLRAFSPDEAVALLVNEIKVSRDSVPGVKPPVVSSALTLIDPQQLEKSCRTAAVELSRELDRDVIEKAEVGISEFDLSIAASGTIVQDASGLHARLVSMLPPVHIALAGTASLVGTFPEALDVIENVYGEEMPPYLSFISGPSKTADIERVLTIGVHGPKKLIVIFIDEN
ncbi:MAG: lactate utilization protein [Candidatus Aminicenantes bacterium]|nr:lactate utilization protein [Candidatus Aminicenantes bacterium]